MPAKSLQALPISVTVRVSRKKDDGRQRSPEEQVDRASRFVRDAGLPVGDTYTDLGVSGAVHPLERPGMKAALDAITAGRAGGIVAFDMSRLSREPSHLEWLAAWMEERGALLLWHGMPSDPRSPIGVMQIGIVAQIDKYHRMVAGERFALSARSAVLQGIPHGPTPFGYYQLEDRTIEPDPQWAPIVVELYTMRVLGHGWGRLARWLSEVTGHPWSRRGVQHIIERPLYGTGRLTLDDTVSLVDSGAIVDEALWHAAQSPKMVRDGRTERARAPLAGLLRCASCGHTLISVRQEGRPSRYRCKYLHCPERVSIAADQAEELVVVESWAQDMRLRVLPEETPDLVSLEDALAGSQRRLDHALRPATQDALGDDWGPTVRDRREARDADAAALGLARSEAGMASGGGQLLHLGHIWPDLQPLQQREALSWLWESVKVCKVERLSAPDLLWVPRATRPVSAVMEFRPPQIEAVA
jgi:DNA invertase Pin-like site-specific DNA recombinase